MHAAGTQRAPAWQGAALAGAFLALGWASSGGIGLTADEHETIEAGLRNLEIIAAVLRGQTPPEWSFHELTGYYFALDTARAAFTRALGLEPVRGFHLAHLLLASATLFFLHRVAARAGASARLALLATAALAVLPKFVAHSQNNPKDLPALFVFTWALDAALRLGMSRRGSDAMRGGAVLGLAFTTRIHAWLALPIAWLWLAIARQRPSVRDAALQAGMLAVGGGVALLLWPWLWPEPLGRLAEVSEKLQTTTFAIPVLYLGEVVRGHELPWHYGPTLFAASTPIALALCAACAPFALFSSRAGEGLRRVALLGAIAFAFPLLAQLFAASRYDGVRHFLIALPGLALLISAGAEFAARAFASSRLAAGLPEVLVRLAPALPLAIAALQLLAIHPYAGAFLNVPARALLGPDANRRVELEYWGQTYREAAEWLLANAAADAEVYAPLLPHVVAHSLGRPPSAAPLSEFRNPSRERYALWINRYAYHDVEMRRIAREYTPVFRIQRQGSVLLEVYSNRARADASRPPDP